MRVVVIWLASLALAICNGALREFVLVPRFGTNVAHVMSCFSLSALILLLTFATIPWLRPANGLRAIEIGTAWTAMTLVFEFGFGRLRGAEWSVLFADYDLLNGRLWILVLATTFLAPFVAARTRGLFDAPGANA